MRLGDTEILASTTRIKNYFMRFTVVVLISTCSGIIMGKRVWDEFIPRISHSIGINEMDIPRKTSMKSGHQIVGRLSQCGN